MDPFSKRLRKQRERSSLQARQLNKNAMTMLRRQLKALEKDEMQNARTLRRTKQAIQEELESFKNIEHEGLGPRQNTPPRPRTLPPLAADPSAASREVTVLHLQSSAVEDGGVHQPRAGSGHVQSLRFNQAWVPHPQAVQERGRSAARGRNVNGGGGATQGDNCGALPCRYRALSPLSPCRYFPCTRPQSYHRLKVSDVDVPSDPIPLGGGGAGGAGGAGGGGDGSMLSPRSQVSSFKSDSTTFLSETQVSVQSSTNDSNRSVSNSLSSRLGEGHASPRTSIQERLRGLKQVARQMRDKNEAKRPRDWAVNYGDPVSRRLLRKPVVAVSELVL